MVTANALEQGRDALGRGAWQEAFDSLVAADRQAALAADDLQYVALAAHLLGRDADTTDFLTRTHNEFLRRGDVAPAARAAVWLAMQFFTRGSTAQGAGWVARARRLLEDGPDCVEQGYVLVPTAFRCFATGDLAASHASFAAASAIGERFGDKDLTTLARHGEGRALIRLGERAKGLELLDEVMVAVTAGDVSPMVVGDIYCSVIEGCNEIYDLRRAQEWTAALNAWCASQASDVAYRAACLVRRSAILQLHGAWPDALEEARRARKRLADPPNQFGFGAALYQLAELHRLRGEFAKAEEAYREAGQAGRSPQPGLAQLRLARGEAGAACAAIRRALDDAPDWRARSRLLAPCVEIALSAGEVAAARAAADELTALAAELDAPLLHAASAQALGAVLLAEGDTRGALAALRRAWAGWRALEAPYDMACTGVLIGVACRAAGDDDTAALEFDAARRAFQQLGAMPDLARVKTLMRPGAGGAAGGLTAREVEVLALIATGKTNRGISTALGISEKTVARHVSNIFLKLGLSSRAAATAFAYQHHLA